MRRAHLTAVIVASLVALVVAGATVWITTRTSTPSPCAVAVDGTHYTIARDQLANANTISDTAANLGLPHHAVTVALTAALQESGLRNVASGDRDSVGLFQQRPSQGWGSAVQLHDTRYASTAFLRALVHTPAWDAMSVNDAAQRVQRSATPNAYRQWEGEARARSVTHRRGTRRDHLSQLTVGALTSLSSRVSSPGTMPKRSVPPATRQRNSLHRRAEVQHALS